jgi:hypothetical protein
MFMFMFLRVQVEEEVLRKYENDLLQKEHSGCAALLRDDKVRRPFLQCSKCVNRAGQDRVWGDGGRLLQKEHSGCAALLRDDKVRRPFLQCSKCVNRAGQDRVWVWVCGLRCCRRSTAGVRHCCVMTR